MSRIFLTVLFSSVITFSAFGQDGDTIRPVGQDGDTILPVSSPDPVEATPTQDTARSNVAIEPDDTIRTFYTGTPAPRTNLADSLVVTEPDFSHSPSKAIMYALVLPGLGQGYNKKYYKIPIVWAAIGGVGYAIMFNTEQFRLANAEYKLNQDATTERYLQFWRRNMELSYIGLIAVYALQVLDAYVDAQLYSWDVNENLSMRITPSIQPMMSISAQTGQSYGLTCRLNLNGR